MESPEPELVSRCAPNTHTVSVNPAAAIPQERKPKQREVLHFSQGLTARKGGNEAWGADKEQLQVSKND